MAGEEDRAVGAEIHAEAVVLLGPAERPAPQRLSLRVDLDDAALEGIVVPSYEPLYFASGTGTAVTREEILDLLD